MISEDSLTYLSPYSLLVHNSVTLKRIYCPFKVEMRDPKTESSKWPQEVAQVGLKAGKMVYLIGNTWYPHSDFRIL